jgi:hypothetical protein
MSTFTCVCVWLLGELFMACLGQLLTIPYNFFSSLEQLSSGERQPLTGHLGTANKNEPFYFIQSNPILYYKLIIATSSSNS